MTQTMNRRYLKFFYISEFLISSALGMIPLMTVLSFMLSSLSHSSLAYAIVLALYNVSTTLPKVYVAKNLSNKENSYKYLLLLRSSQLFVWLAMSVLFSTYNGDSFYIIIFCLLYLLYALIKGSVDVLNLDIYSRVVSRDRIGKFFGYKYSLNSFAEFSGAMILAAIFGNSQLSSNYGVIFSIVLVLDLLSFGVLLALKNKINLSTEDYAVEYAIKLNDEIALSNGIVISNITDEALKDNSNFIKKVFIYVKINFIVLRDEIKQVIKTDSVYSSFLRANVISIIGASVASFFIPYGTQILGLTMKYISIANLIWLISKIISSVIWGYVVDAIGSKYVMIASRTSLILSYLIAMNLNSLGMFYTMIILHGFSSSALVIMAQNIFIEISGNKGALYSAINSVVCMPFFVIMPLLASFISENYGYELSFALSLIPLIISVLFMFKINLHKTKTS